MSVVYLADKKRVQHPALQPPLDGNMLRVHCMNADPMSALHGELELERRTPWLAVSIVLVGLVVLIWCWARYLMPWLAP